MKKLKYKDDKNLCRFRIVYFLKSLTLYGLKKYLVKKLALLMSYIKLIKKYITINLKFILNL